MASKNCNKPENRAADQLRAKGYSLRAAASVLGCHWTHVHKVLTGARVSASLLRRVESLPPRSATLTPCR